MAESKIRDDNFFLVSGWMLNRLNLKGTALQVFSIIYGFSQEGEGSFTGSLQYLCDFTNASRNTVLKALKELVEVGYITKTENTINGVRFCTYKTAPGVQNLNRGSAETELGVVQKLNWGSAETEPNNKDNNKSLISKDIVKEVIDLYHSICVSFPKIRTVTDKRRAMIQARLNTFSMEDFKSMFEKVEASSFLKGVNDRGWSATFDWLINEANMTKVLEDQYKDKTRRKEMVPGWAKPFEPTEEELEFVNRALREDPP
jgi:DNA-binding MarR family transcriptional regulator